MVMFMFFCVIFGAAMGSFACCQAWRLRLKATGKKDPGKRSVCLKCGKKLTWYENIPVVSWVVQRGKCRKCGKKIGAAEILAELGGAVAFGLVGWKFAQGEMEAVTIVEMAIVVIFTTIVMILAVYDAKWRELPVSLLVAANMVGAAYAAVDLIWGEMDVVRLVEGVGILAGTYYLLYFLSGERLVGGGDWLLCLAIALVLGEPWLAVWVLFLSNFIGAVVMMPQKKKKIAFGPFLVMAFVIVYSFSDVILKYI